MMKIARKISIVLICIVSFLISALIFAPWRSIGTYAADRVRLMAAQNGIYIRYGGIDAQGMLPTFSFSHAEVETPMAMLSLEGVTLRPLLLQSLLSLSIVFEIDLGRCEISVMPGGKFNVSSIHMRMAYGGSTIAGDELSCDGDIALSGAFRFGLEDRKMIESSIVFNVSDALEPMLRNPLASRFIEPADGGGWRIRYEAQNR